MSKVVSIVKKAPPAQSRPARWEASPFAGSGFPGSDRLHDPGALDAPLRMGRAGWLVCTAFWALVIWVGLSGYFHQEPPQDHAATVTIDDFGRH